MKKTNSMDDPAVLIKAQWDRIGAGLPEMALLNDFWEPVLTAYSGKDRRYHGLRHIADFLSKIDHWEPHFAHPDLARWAAIFHDVIYKAGRKDNEAKSAEMAVEALSKAGADAQSIAWIDQAIRRTATHDGQHADPDTLLFLDIDLSILGAPPKTYTDYTEAIRYEYRKIPWFLYKNGRKKVLRHFLERDRIYYTDLLHAQYDAQARANLQAELATLS